MTTTRECKIDGCEGQSHARGWCTKHYLRWYKWGDPTIVHTQTPAPPKPKPSCAQKGCDRLVEVGDLCQKHYYAKLDASKRAKGELCQWPRCKKGPRVGGFCMTHYSRVRYNRELEHMLTPELRAERCELEECDNPAYAKGLCRRHKALLDANGTPTRIYDPVVMNPHRIRAALVCQGYVISDIAHALGVSRSRAGQIASSGKMPREAAKQIARLVGVSVEWLAEQSPPRLDVELTHEKSLDDRLRAELRGSRRALQKAYDFMVDDSNITFKSQDARDGLLGDIRRELRGL